MQSMNQNDLSTELAKELVKEKRLERRWKNIRFVFWFLLFAYTIYSVFSWLGGKTSVSGLEGNGKYVALITLDGMIAPGREFSAKETLPVLRDAFKDKNAAGVVISINSPGGTPVQASIIHDAILSFKQKYHKKVIVVGEDMLTSGAYYVAVAGDKIYVNPNTLTGSIGVIMKGFGFVDLLKKVGIERRVYTAGNDKDRLDPFLPQTPSDLEKVKQVMGEVHQNFVQAVLASRKDKLHAAPEIVFSGDFWSGESALKLGLVDALGNTLDVMEKEFGTTTYKEYGGGPAFLRMIGGQLTSSLDALVYE